MENNIISYGGFSVTHDYHTHTVFSHGKGTIEENVKAALALGLKGIGISDHGPGHLTYGVKRKNFPVMRAEIERLKKVYPEIEIYLSVEANIVSKGNFLDVSEEECGLFDYVIAGYHYGITGGYCIRNYINEKILGGKSSKSLLIKNTEMVVNALYNNNIKILTHPGDKACFDMDELAKACADTGTLMEINTWHSHLTEEEIRIASKYDVSFTVSSDAHTPGRVGDVAEAIRKAIENGVEPERIVNIRAI